MNQEIFSIPNISCGHCTSAIKSELEDLDGVTKVDGNIDAKTVAVVWDNPADRNQIIDKLKEINYPAEE